MIVTKAPLGLGLALLLSGCSNESPSSPDAGTGGAPTGGTSTGGISGDAGTGGSGTATHFGVGTAASGAGVLLYSGTLTPNIVCGDGVTPRINSGQFLTED